MDRGPAAAAINYVYELSSAGGPPVAATAAGAVVSSAPPPGGVGVAAPPHGAMLGGVGQLVEQAQQQLGMAAPPPPHEHLAGNAVGLNAAPPPPHLAADENYCLRWNDYEKKYAETFRVLRDDEYFTDVTLATEGHSVKAHRVILSACSNYFHAILKTMSPWQHPVLLLQDVRSTDLNSLMDFIYFGQASVSQDSLQSFLRVAEKLKIKGLCESPPPPPPLPVVTTASPPTHQPPQVPLSAGLPTIRGPPPVQAAQVPVSNFEGLLPRTPYIPEPSVVPLSCAAPVAPPPPPPVALPPGPSPVNASGRPSSSSAPPMAHQSPRQTSRPAVLPPPPQPPAPRPAAEPLVHYASPKRAKYSPLPPQSILRSQLQIKEGGAVVPVPAGAVADHIEVKSEPMSILSTPQEDVPSSGVSAATVSEFIAHDGDLTLQSLSQGISPQLMFSPDPSADPNGAAQQGGPPVTHVVAAANGPPPPTATLVAIDDKANGGVAGTSMGLSTATVVTSMATANHHQLLPQQPVAQQHQHLVAAAVHHVEQQQQQQQVVQQQHRHPDEQPQDLTPAPQDSPALTHTPPANNGSVSMQTTPGTPTPGGSGSMGSPSTPTPPKKDRNSRKTCGYCHKDFHEMSLKRHIKDVHFRSQNTYVICPQCCKQYASQNSLYSHLNRVHGVKKEMMPSAADLQLASAQQQQQQQQQQHQQGVATASSPAPAANNSSQVVAVSAAAGHVAVVQSPAGGGGGNSSAGNNHHDGIMDLAHHSDSSN